MQAYAENNSESHYQARGDKEQPPPSTACSP